MTFEGLTENHLLNSIPQKSLRRVSPYQAFLFYSHAYSSNHSI